MARRPFRRLRVLAGYYGAAMKVSASTEFQYRASNYLQLAGMTVEAVIYLELWQAVTLAGGGEVRGWDAREIAAYFVVWTLVRNMTTVFPPSMFESRIRYGYFNHLLLRPLHPIHYDIAECTGWKLVMIVLWVPVGVGMSIVYRPAMSVEGAELVAFLFAICGAFLLRAMYCWLIGAITFWTTRASGVFDLFFGLELLLSGRLLPMDFLPGWMLAIADFLPFRWVFDFPIQTLAGDHDVGHLLHGVAMQAVWLTGCAVGVLTVWRFAARRYSAVGN